MTVAPPLPKEPLSPSDPKVNLMRGDQGPFRCGNCKYFKGNNKSCPWVNTRLYEDDCCNQYRKHLR